MKQSAALILGFLLIAIGFVFFMLYLKAPELQLLACAVALLSGCFLAGYHVVVANTHLAGWVAEQTAKNRR